MPRKPTRHNPSLRHRPLTFSPFGRSMAMATSSKKARREIEEPKDFPTFSGNGCVNHGKDKTEQSDSSDSEDFEGVVQADFVFFDPKPGDFHGVKVLLQTYLDNKLWDLSGFVDLILGQPTDNKCIIELKDYLLNVCEDMDVIPKLRNLVGEHAKDVGLVVSQRVVNLPPQLLPPLYDALFDEIEWATEDEPTVELQNFFRFKYYLIMSKIYKVDTLGSVRYAICISVDLNEHLLITSLCMPIAQERKWEERDG
ncbi:UNVERIFIED_CONTAM: protein BCCIP [Sesamum latifolium]|uniref:Protein BCCIP n=1 Tax=Sesamum latifolium TaxID=2727402 RepID=A0AAW2X3B4_9LAMI